MIKPVSCCLCAIVKSLITLTYQSTSQIYQGPGSAWMYVVLLYLSNISIYSQVNPPPSKNMDATYMVPVFQDSTQRQLEDHFTIWQRPNDIIFPIHTLYS